MPARKRKEDVGAFQASRREGNKRKGQKRRFVDLTDPLEAFDRCALFV
jgi:hypothetical protein